MSELIPHECGIAYVRLLRPLDYYRVKYGTALYGFNKLSLLMQKQRNRGQDGVGIGCCKLGTPLGRRYLFHDKSVEPGAVTRVFEKQLREFRRLRDSGQMDPENGVSVKEHFAYGGENLVGHLRYTTSGGVSLNYCHPQVRETTWATKTLLMLGNFNMTNVGLLKKNMVKRGQHPFHDTDTQVVLEEVGFHLDEAHTDIYRAYRDEKKGEEIPALISRELNIASIVQESAANWDGGYVLVGLVGNGDGFVVRDPHGIRPCYYFADDELIVFASERPPLLTVFDKKIEDVKELPPGHVACIKHDGTFELTRFAAEREPRACSFERIYFSRGNDPDIYAERKALGRNLVPQVLEIIENDFENTVFSFIPNTAETGYYGLMNGMREERRKEVRRVLGQALRDGTLTERLLDEVILGGWPRDEKVANKDEKFRTFISQEEGRNELVSFAYDISYGTVRPGQDNLVVLDDSIVRGTTLRESIVKILSRTEPKKIVIVSTAPQIRYPDFYGIDMSELGKFLAFKAAVALLERSGRKSLLDEVFNRCQDELRRMPRKMENCVKAVYEPFTEEELAEEMARQVRPDNVPWKGEIRLLFQTIENLHQALPNHRGDWYFTGDYPTPGGVAAVNRAFVYHCEGKEVRPTDEWI